MGVTIAIFHSSGRTACSIQSLKRFVIIGVNTLAADLSTFDEIPEAPGPLVDDKG